MFGPTEQLKTWAIIGLAIALVLAIGTATIGIHYYRSEYLVEKANYAAFVEKTNALGEAAKLAKKTKEDEDAKRIVGAESERDTARRLLNAERTSRSRMRLTPQAANGSNEISFDSKALDAAVERYRGRVRELVIQGDEAQIDAATLLKSWPTAQPAK